MKMSASSAVVSRDNITTDVSFKIKASGKAFKILSDTLYTDKPRAIIRELSCNAYDAHVAAGRPKDPFLVKLPTTLDPSLIIRDYGIGLSHQDVITIATTYFESTKTESNDFVGALGLGSKSPFSYVDSYTITSYFNGVKRIYCAFIDSDETPKITLMNGVYADASASDATVRETEDGLEVMVDGQWWSDGEFTGDRTTDPNGLEISMPVRERDIWVFHEKARAVFQHFTVRPTTIPALEFRDDVQTSGSNWAVSPNGSYGVNFIAVQGNVAYPVDVAALSVTDLGYSSMAFVNKLSNYRGHGGSTVTLKFNIGDLDVAASREGLSYKKTTYDSLATALSTMEKEMAAVGQVDIDACESVWDAMVMRDVKFSSTIMHMISSKLTYDGEPIPESFKVTAADIATMGVIKYKPANRVTLSTSLVTSGFEVSTSRWGRSEFVIKDCRDALSRIRHNFRDPSVYFIEPPVGVDVKAMLNKLMPGYPVHLASELTAAPVVARVHSGSKNTTVGNVRTLRLDSNKASINIFRSEVDMTLGGVYVENRGGSVQWDDTTVIDGTISGRCKLLLDDFIERVDVIVPYANDLKKFKSSKKWITLKEYVESQMKQPKVIAEIQQVGTTSTAAIDREASQMVCTDNFRALATAFHTSKPQWLDMIRKCDLYQNNHVRRTVVIPDIAAAYNIKLPSDNALVDTVNATHRDLMTKYPIVKLLNSYWLNKELVDAAKAYVNAIDRCEVLEQVIADNGIKA